MTLWDPIDCSLPGSSVHGILQARILEWAAMPSSRGIYSGIEPTSPTSPALARRFLTTSTTWEAFLKHLNLKASYVLVLVFMVGGCTLEHRASLSTGSMSWQAVTAAPTTVTCTQEVSMVWMNACLCSLTRNSSRNSPVLFKTETTEQIINEWVQLPF